MYQCPTCKHELMEVPGFNGDFFYCAPCNEMYKRDELEFAKLPWFKRLTENNEYWHQPALEQYPAIIAHEYERLHDLLKQGQTYGAVLQLKDVFEVLIKFPILIQSSIIYHKQTRSDEENKILINLLQNPLSLGDWTSIGRAMTKELELDQGLKMALLEIIKIFDKHQIVSWRNSEIGHGALSFDASEEFQQSMREKLIIIRNYMQETEGFYTNLSFELKRNNKIVPLHGKDKARKLPNQQGELFITLDGKSQNLYPYVLLNHEGIYFFDSFYSKKNKAFILNYPEGIKKNSPTSITKDLKKSLNTLKHSGFLSDIKELHSIDDTSYSLLEEKVLHKLQEVDDFERPNHLANWVQSTINEQEKGVFLLQMERGMGKTTFTRSLDEQSISRIKLSDASVRSYYINDSYAYKVDHFLLKMNDLLRQDAKGNTVIQSTHNIERDALDKKRAFAELLNDYQKEHKKYFGRDKLLLIIDGLDEMPPTSGESIFHFIPDAEQLNENVFLLLTCRTDEEISEFCKYHVEKIQTTIIPKVIHSEDEQNIESLKNYIFKHILEIKSKKQQPTEKQIEWTQSIIDLARYRFLYLKPIKELIQLVGPDKLPSLPKGDELFEYYLGQLEALYGDKYFHHVIQLLTIIGTSYEPLTFREISSLFGEERPTFKLLAYLSDLRGFIKVERSYRGNLFSIAHDYWKQIIFSQYPQVVNSTVTGFIEQVKNVAEVDMVSIEWNKPENDGWTYLFSKIERYIRDFSELAIDKVINDTVFDQLYFITKHLSETEDNQEYQLKRALTLSSMLIEVVKGRQQVNRELLVDLYELRWLMNETYFKKHKNALEDIQEATKWWKEIGGKRRLEEDFRMLSLMVKQGHSLRSIGRLEDALKFYTQVLSPLSKRGFKKVEDYELSISLSIHSSLLLNEVQRYGDSLNILNHAIKQLTILQKDWKIENTETMIRAYRERALILSQMHRFSEALRDIQTAVAMDKKLLEQGKGDIQSQIESKRIRSIVYFDMGRYQNAIHDLTEIIDETRRLMSEGKAWIEIDLVKYYMNRGTSYSRFGQYAQAIQDYNQGIEIISRKLLVDDQNDAMYMADSYGRRAEAYMNMGEFSLANSDALKSLNIVKKMLDIDFIGPSTFLKQICLSVEINTKAIMYSETSADRRKSIDTIKELLCVLARPVMEQRTLNDESIIWIQSTINMLSALRKYFSTEKWAEISDWIDQAYVIIENNKIKKTVQSRKIGRNEPCPCGSGKKYKNCCGK